jgi:hypothetical protein
MRQADFQSRHLACGENSDKEKADQRGETSVVLLDPFTDLCLNPGGERAQRLDLVVVFKITFARRELLDETFYCRRETRPCLREPPDRSPFRDQTFNVVLWHRTDEAASVDGQSEEQQRDNRGGS